MYGIPEVTAYFIAAIVGGIISFALMGFLHKKVSADNMRKIMRHSVMFLLVGLLILAIGAIIEGYIIPLF